MSQPINILLANSLNLLCETINEWATEKGWNDDPFEGFGESLPISVLHRMELALAAEQLALFHSEISECLEFKRVKDQPAMDDKVPELTGEAAELADILIRVFHYCGKRKINLGEAVALKHNFNITRPHRHGKLA